MIKTSKEILGNLSSVLKKSKIDVMSLGDDSVGAIVNHRIPTSSLLLNHILGGGIPCGRLTEIFGEESNGKSSLCADITAHVQQMGGTAIIIDSEHSFSPERAIAMGVNVDDVIYSDESTVEDIFEVMEATIDELNSTDTFAVIIWDSVGASTTRKELDGEMDDRTPAEAARLIGRGLKKVIAKLNNKTALIFTNQVRTKFNVSFGKPTQPVGGFAIRYYSSIRLELTKIGKLTSEERSIGIKCKAYTAKNKTSPPFKTVNFDMLFSGGIDDTNSLLDLLVERKAISLNGSWYFDQKRNKKFMRKDFKTHLQELDAESVKDLTQQALEKL